MRKFLSKHDIANKSIFGKQQTGKKIIINCTAFKTAFFSLSAEL